LRTGLNTPSPSPWLKTSNWDSMSVRNVGIYPQVHASSQPRRSTSIKGDSLTLFDPQTVWFWLNSTAKVQACWNMWNKWDYLLNDVTVATYSGPPDVCRRSGYFLIRHVHVRRQPTHSPLVQTWHRTLATGLHSLTRRDLSVFAKEIKWRVCLGEPPPSTAQMACAELRPVARHAHPPPRPSDLPEGRQICPVNLQPTGLAFEQQTAKNWEKMGPEHQGIRILLKWQHHISLTRSSRPSNAGLTSTPDE
jgi:hypothetical protein